jgi:hypothetical protein
MSLEDMPIDQLLAYAQQLEQNVGVLQVIAQNPETREGFQRLLKKINPKLSIPELDAVDRANSTIIKPLTDKLASLERSIQERDILDRLEKSRAQVKAKYRLSDEDLTGVETLMVRSESNPDPIPSYDAAARVYVASRQSAPATPAAFAPPIYTMPEKETWARGIGNPQELNRIALNEAFSAWNDLRSGKVPGLGVARGAAM